MRPVVRPKMGYWLFPPPLAFIYGAEVVPGTGERLGGTAALRVGQASEPVKFSEINRTDHRAQKSTA